MLCQCLVAVDTLVEDGVFVCRVSDTLGRFSVGIIFLLTTVFEKVAVFKSELSCPVKNERFLVCKGFAGKGKAEKLDKYLRQVVDRANECRAAANNTDVLALVQQPDVMKSKLFVASMIKMNERDCGHEALHIKELLSLWKEEQVQSGLQILEDVNEKEELVRLGLLQEQAIQ